MGIIKGLDDPIKHTRGDVESIFTSWSYYEDVADYMGGRKDAGGVVLTKKFKKARLFLRQ